MNEAGGRAALWAMTGMDVYHHGHRRRHKSRTTVSLSTTHGLYGKAFTLGRVIWVSGLEIVPLPEKTSKTFIGCLLMALGGGGSQRFHCYLIEGALIVRCVTSQL